jgi:hypothetical protein
VCLVSARRCARRGFTVPARLEYTARKGHSRHAVLVAVGPLQAAAHGARSADLECSDDLYPATDAQRNPQRLRAAAPRLRVKAVQLRRGPRCAVGTRRRRGHGSARVRGLFEPPGPPLCQACEQRAGQEASSLHSQEASRPRSKQPAQAQKQAACIAKKRAACIGRKPI